MNIKFSKEDIENHNGKIFEHEEVFAKLKEAIKNQKLVIFLGSGISMLGGCESWLGLTKQLIDHLTSVKVFNFSEQRRLHELCSINLRKAITICMNRAVKNGKVDDYNDSIIKSVTPNNYKVFDEIHKSIIELEPLFFITTNIDDGIERNLPSDIYNNPSRLIFNLTDETSLDKVKININFQGNIDQMVLSHMKYGNIYYLHGSKKAISKTIFKDDDYYVFYEKPRIKKFLREVFSGEYTVLFIGYSLSEHEILSNLFLSMNNNSLITSVESPQHYSLLPIFSSEINDIHLEEEYLNIFKIQPVFYYIDFESYNALSKILVQLNGFKNKIYNPLDLLESFSSIK